jgi:ATP-dependent helicase/nuclease subunit A
VKESRPGFRGDLILARPGDWEARAQTEERFEDAEAVRLLYVAVTRARDELVVARWPKKPEASVWSPLDPWLEAHATQLDLVAQEPAERSSVSLTPQAAAEAAAAAAERLSSLAQPSFRHVSVTSVAKEVGDPPTRGMPQPTPGNPVRDEFRGYSWGSAVHGALAAAAEGLHEGALLAACRALLVEQGRPLDDHGDPVELEELFTLVRTVRTSELWRRARASTRMMAEVPFAAAGLDRGDPDEPGDVPPGGTMVGRRQLDLFGGGAEPQEDEGVEAGPPATAGPMEVLEGIIDLAFHEEGGWVIADYKTDVGTDPDFPARVEAYRRQVDLYARAWAHLTGQPVKERVLFFTSQGRMESW